MTTLFAQGLRRETIALSYTFTLTFPGGQIAVLDVRGAANQKQARDLARHALLCRYSVADGNQSNGYVDAFYLWYEPAKEEGR